MDVYGDKGLWMFHWVRCLCLWFGHDSGCAVGYVGGVHCYIAGIAQDELSPFLLVPPYDVRVVVGLHLALHPLSFPIARYRDIPLFIF